MNQPSEDRIRQIEERQAEIERRLRDVERYITPIKFTQLEIDSGSIFRRLDEIQDSVNTVKTQMEGVRADVRVVKANHSEIKGYLENHSQRLECIEQKQEAHAELLGQLISIGQTHTATLETVATKEDLKSMATKEDLTQLETRLVGTITRLLRQ
jgi:chromosome segregation ATPase